MARTIRKAKQSTDSSSGSKRQKVESPLKPGDQVVFHNLNPDDDLHGKSGELVQYHDGKIKYWEVITEDDMLVDMEAKNLKRKESNEIATAAPDQEFKSLSCPTHVYVLILEEWNHGWGSGQESKVIGVYISKEAAVLASGDINTSYGTFDKAIEPNRGDFSSEFDHKDYRSNPPDDGILIQLGGDDIGEGDYIRLKIQKMPLLQ